MPLIGSDALLARFNHLVGTSTHVDIAVAWAGPGLAVELLLENVHDTEVRVVVGLSGNSTEPATLRRLMAEDSVALRVAPAPMGRRASCSAGRTRSFDRHSLVEGRVPVDQPSICQLSFCGADPARAGPF